MSSDRVSDEISNTTSEIIKAVIRNRRSCDGSTIYGEEVRDAIIAILQARRAAEQAALPAVEEMAEQFNAAFKLVLARDGVDHWDDVHRSQITEAVNIVTTPLYAKLAALEQQLSRNQQFVADQGQAIVERDSMLVECRDKLTGNGECSASCDECREERERCIARIDALLGAKGETGC